MSLQAERIHITGIVQGVGFRPFVFSLAQRLELRGWVRNTSAGVDIEVDGDASVLSAFRAALKNEAPPLASIDLLEFSPIPVQGFCEFTIVHSEPIAEAFQPISPDVAACPECLQELFDPGNRRYRYPFINCTNCGPRFTIIQDIPYDRPQTTMSGFRLCPDCAREYSDPLDRRFHAQPVACPVCGPHIWLETRDTPFREDGQPEPAAIEEDALTMAIRLLSAGKILAIKGLGGFHLACDATNQKAVDELRQRKLRVDKPFAVMMPNLEVVQEHCFVSAQEAALLKERARPIVILRRRPNSPVAHQVTPGQNSLGVMLPYTPLHALLFSPDPKAAGAIQASQALVMTSGNLSEEPIATENDEARQRLGSLADAFLMHNRPIHVRCDDSVVRSPGETDSRIMPIRRSRGYAPFPVKLPWNMPAVLAAGAELKNTFCLTNGHYAFLSQHIGDLENYETLHSYEEGIVHFERLFRVHPQAIAYDLHPDYMATRYALERSQREGLPATGVQHHHAHVAACMAENQLEGDEPVLGVAFDGTGYGEDGAIWGGEFLLADYHRFRRLAHLRYIPLPGGDRAMREPWRTALAWLDRAGLEWSQDLAPVRAALSHPTFGETTLDILRHQLSTGANTPKTSSMGRLFDAVAALCSIRQVVNYEAQAAIEFEALVDPAESGKYPFDLLAPPGDHTAYQVDPTPALAALVTDLRRGVPLPCIASRFHNGVAEMVVQVCQRLRQDTDINRVALSGGVWQNVVIFNRARRGLGEAGFQVLVHEKAPANDGGLALGQAVIAAQRLQNGLPVSEGVNTITAGSEPVKISPGIQPPRSKPA